MVLLGIDAERLYRLLVACAEFARPVELCLNQPWHGAGLTHPAVC